jgi:hypothetical protein
MKSTACSWNILVSVGETEYCILRKLNGVGVRGRKRLRKSKKMKEPILSVTAGSIHTYNLVLTKIQNHKTVVPSTAINGHTQFHIPQRGTYAP